MKKLFFGTVLDNEDRSHKAIMEKGFVEKKELYYQSPCSASTHDENYIYTVNSGNYTVNKLRKSNFEIVGTYNLDESSGIGQMREVIESDDDFIYILKRSSNPTSSYSIVKIEKETMNKVAESIFYGNVTGYTTDNEQVYLVTNTDTHVLSKENLIRVDYIAGAWGNAIAVDSNYIYVYNSNTSMAVYNKITHARSLISIDVSNSLTKLVVHNENLYLVTSNRIIRFNTERPFNQLASAGASYSSVYFGTDGFYLITSKDIRKLNLPTLLLEWIKPLAIDDTVSYLLKEEDEDFFYYFHASDRNTLRTLREGYKLIGYERVE